MSQVHVYIVPPACDYMDYVLWVQSRTGMFLAGNRPKWKRLKMGGLRNKSKHTEVASYAGDFQFYVSPVGVAPSSPQLDLQVSSDISPSLPTYCLWWICHSWQQHKHFCWVRRKAFNLEARVLLSSSNCSKSMLFELVTEPQTSHTIRVRAFVVSYR